MGLLDQVIGGMLGGQSGNNANSGIGGALMDLLAPGGQSSNGFGQNSSSMSSREQGGLGGLGGLLDSFTRSGHGDIADSWVGTGQNRPIEPRQLEQALDRNTIDRLSQRTGLSRDELLRQLSEHLPNAVDRLTPQGRRPGPEDMGHW